MMWNTLAAFLLAGAVVAQMPAPPPVAPSVSPITLTGVVDPMVVDMANLTGMEPAGIGSPMPSSVASPPASLADLPIAANMPTALPSMSAAPADPLTQIAEPAMMAMAPMVSPMMLDPSPGFMMPSMEPSMMPMGPLAPVSGGSMMTYPSPGFMMPSMEPSMMPMAPLAPVSGASGPLTIPAAPARAGSLTIPVAPARVICPNTCRLSFKGVVGTPSYTLSGAPDAAFTPGISGNNFATALEVGEPTVNGTPISQTGLTPNALGLYAIGFRGSYGVGYRTMSPAQKATLDGACVVLPVTHYIDGAGTEVVVSTNPAVDCVAFRITAAVVRTPAPVAPVLPVTV